LLTALSILKLLNNDLYRRYVSGQCNSEEIIKFILERPRGENFLNTYEGRLIDAYLFAASPEEWRKLAVRQMSLLFEKKDLTQPEFLPERMKKMRPDYFERLLNAYSDILRRWEDHLTNKTLGYLSQKIELASLMLDYME
jgi:hypothetical protein